MGCSSIFSLGFIVSIRIQERGFRPAASSLNKRSSLTASKNNLITLALDCLRNCLELLRLTNSVCNHKFVHQDCDKSACKIDCVLSAEKCIKLFVDELSCVFFKKDNIRSKEGWWLSAFYSLCIQGFVRRALIQLNPESCTDDETNQYLYLAIRLFGASSGTYDPLTRDYATCSEGSDNSMAGNFKAAQLSLHQYKWTSSEITGSVNYLKRLFEDKGDCLKPRRMTVQTLGWTADTQLLKLYKFNVPVGQEPYFDLRPQWPVSPETPQRVYLDPPPINQTRNYSCRYPGCTGKVRVFGRPANLIRHYKNVHLDPDIKDFFACDHRNCGRSFNPFSRKDHLRDHFRDYHKEPIGNAKGEKSMRNTPKWLEVQSWLNDRVYKANWWRCGKCLCRIMISDRATSATLARLLVNPRWSN
ncbi:uncharacterized protein LY89DRAFT_177184 [Mollisia scopiformis]|uniref:C2H2-type domain-containing protein n=1 Tax=Mollisia scopiformis TaxID=149040 RepID=A0A194XSY2_MOLSC|nr:uncharacterized protein LY89DRAFT_177184 [Mollisia scopiformis]KUJ23251.1 hypothetical protein LY89DRAFT_177184 [Mollisia scopiformis]